MPPISDLHLALVVVTPAVYSDRNEADPIERPQIEG
jgi:hypothetical protein